MSKELIAMDDLPFGWKLKDISDIAKIKGGKRLPKNSSLSETKTAHPYIRVTDFEDDGTINLSSLKYIDEETFKAIKNYTIQSNDLYISIAGTIGKTGIIQDELNGANLTENAVKLEYLDKKSVCNKYVFYYTLSADFMQQAGLATKAVAMPKLAISRLSTIKIPLPVLSEQTRIVAKLDALFTHLDKAIKLVEDNLEHINHLLPNALNEVFDKTDEKGWNKMKCFDVISITSKTIKPDHDTEYNIIGLENIERDSGKLVDFTKQYGRNSTSNKVTFQKGMVLYGKLRPYLNKVWVAEFDGIATTEILPFTVNSKKAIPEYVAYYFRCGWFLNLVNENCAGARMPRLTTKFWNDAKMPIPDLPTQQKIVTHLNTLATKQQQLKTEYLAKLKHLKSLKASLLDAAFKGQL